MCVVVRMCFRCQGVFNCQDVWLSGCVVVKVCSCQGVLLSGCVVVRVCVVVKVCSCQGV